MDDFVIVKTHVTPEEFDEIKKALNCVNIAVASQAVLGSGKSNLYCSLLVHRDMYKTAAEMTEQVLTEFRSRPEWKLRSCIECDSNDYERIHRGFLRELFSSRKLYRCNNCGNEWQMQVNKSDS